MRDHTILIRLYFFNASVKRIPAEKIAGIGIKPSFSLQSQSQNPFLIKDQFGKPLFISFFHFVLERETETRFHNVTSQSFVFLIRETFFQSQSPNFSWGDTPFVNPQPIFFGRTAQLGSQQISINHDILFLVVLRFIEKQNTQKG